MKMVQKSKVKNARVGVVILAAGKGTRMRSSLPKVLQEVGGQPLLFHVLNSVLKTASQAPIAIVIGHEKEQIQKKVLADERFKKMNLTWIHQEQQNGTGHAAKTVMDSEWGTQRVKSKEHVLVLPGDLPLIQNNLIEQMIQPLVRGTALRLLSCTMDDPTGYGRVVRRGKKGSVLRIVEQKDANAREKLIQEVATSIYLFNPSFLRAGLRQLNNKNASKEYYLTDLIAQAAKVKKKIESLAWETPQDLKGVNNPWELSQAGLLLNQRCLYEWSQKGVRFMDPASTWVESTVEFDSDVFVYPGAILKGNTKIESNVVIGPRVYLENTTVKKGSELKIGTVAYDSVVGSGAKVGPYAHLRPGTKVGNKVKIGNFVELKQSEVGEETSIAHLSYIGDAKVGSRVNIGCGFVTCNFDGQIRDGKRKHKTVIEDDVFMGSDCQTVAPVTVGKGAYVASGSTITKNVDSGDMAIARSRQVNKKGYAKRFRSQEKKVIQPKGEANLCVE